MDDEYTTIRVKKKNAKQLKKAAKQISVSERDGEEVTISEIVEKLLNNIKITNHI